MWIIGRRFCHLNCDSLLSFHGSPNEFAFSQTREKNWLFSPLSFLPVILRKIRRIIHILRVLPKFYSVMTQEERVGRGLNRTYYYQQQHHNLDSKMTNFKMQIGFCRKFSLQTYCIKKVLCGIFLWRGKLQRQWWLWSLHRQCLGAQSAITKVFAHFKFLPWLACSAKFPKFAKVCSAGNYFGWNCDGRLFSVRLRWKFEEVTSAYQKGTINLWKSHSLILRTSLLQKLYAAVQPLLLHHYHHHLRWNITTWCMIRMLSLMVPQLSFHIHLLTMWPWIEYNK